MRPLGTVNPLYVDSDELTEALHSGYLDVHPEQTFDEIAFMVNDLERVKNPLYDDATADSLAEGLYSMQGMGLDYLITLPAWSNPDAALPGAADEALGGEHAQAEAAFVATSAPRGAACTTPSAAYANLNLATLPELESMYAQPDAAYAELNVASAVAGAGPGRAAHPYDWVGPAAHPYDRVGPAAEIKYGEACLQSDPAYEQATDLFQCKDSFMDQYDVITSLGALNLSESLYGTAPSGPSLDDDQQQYMAVGEGIYGASVYDHASSFAKDGALLLPADMSPPERENVYGEFVYEHMPSIARAGEGAMMVGAGAGAGAEEVFGFDNELDYADVYGINLGPGGGVG